MSDSFEFSGEQTNSQPPTAQVMYKSTGHCLIVAEGDFGIDLSRQLPDLQCTVLIVDDTQDNPVLMLSEDGDRLLRAGGASVSGYLGAFDVQLKNGGDSISAAELAELGIANYDLVLDAGGAPLVSTPTLPLGYFAPRDEESLQAAVAEANEMIGEFEKPIFSLYDQKKCAHGASGKRGCEACVTACSAGAIVSIGNRISLDTMLCMGCGTCTSVCPTGALRFAYPDAVSSLNQLRDTLQMSEGALRTVLFYDAEVGETYLQAQRETIPDTMLPVAVEEVNAIGMDIWLSLLAFGAGNVVLLVADLEDSYAQLVAEQIEHAQDMLSGLGYSRKCVQMLSMAQGAQMSDVAAMPALLSEPATYALFDDKRQIIRRAMDRLTASADVDVPSFVALKPSAPFGAINVDKDKCTLCMACVSSCPTSSLLAMGDVPGLRFVEESCVQCGLCRNTCPENALSRDARYLYDTNVAREQRELHSEEPYRCLRCAKPFATRSGIETITAKLADHPMFQEPGSLNRLRMCDDCRVIDMMESKSPTLNS